MACRLAPRSHIFRHTRACALTIALVSNPKDASRFRWLTPSRRDRVARTVLADVQKFSPAYNPAPGFFTQTHTKYPKTAGVFTKISPALTDEPMRALNLQVDVQGEEPADVAFEWMKKQGFITDAR